MKFTIDRQTLVAGLNTVSTAIDSKTTIPILNGIKLTLTTEGLYLTGSNGEISIEWFIPSTDNKAKMIIQETGALVLPAGFFSSIVKSLPDAMVTVETTSDSQVTITSGTSIFNLNYLNASDYPQLPVVEQNNLLQMPVQLLNELIKETTFAASRQETRPILTGVHFTFANGEFKAVATDSHRLSQRILPMEEGLKEFDMVIPAKSLLDLAKSFQNDSEFVEISSMENQVLFKTPRMSFYSRLLEGNYPNTDRLIPENYETSATFNVRELLSSVERASLMAHETANINLVRLHLNEDEITLTSQSPEIGNVEETLTPIQYEGRDLTIAFNPDYMKAALKAFKGEEVRIQFISPVRPFTLIPEESDQNIVQLITPVRTN